jgi:hypothetical protein
MRKGIVIGSILVVLIMALLPTTSVAESNSASVRIEKQQALLKELQENLFPKDGEPTCILRLLLWLRNIIILTGLLILIRTIKKLFNISSISVSN